MTIRVNQANLQGTISATGIGTANSTVGPYSYRGGTSIKGVAIHVASTNTTDAVQVYLTEPAQALATDSAAKPYNAQGGGALGTLTCPANLVLDSNLLGAQCDIYVVGTTATGSISVSIRKLP